MRGVQRWWMALAVWLWAALPVCAANRVLPVTDATAFGQAVTLSGPWLVAPGDDPRGAQASLDDSGWARLQPGGRLPSQGFEGARSVWYRMHVQVRPGGPPMALYVERLYFNYTAYVNGIQIGQQGESRPGHVHQFHPPEAFGVPQPLLEAAGGQIVLALHVSAGTYGLLGMAPLMHETRLELVSPAEVQLRQSFRVAHDWSESIAVLALNLLVGLCGLVIWWSLREQHEYLALAVWLLCNAATVVLNFWAHLTGAGPLDAAKLLLVLSLAAGSVAELEFMRLLLRRRRSSLWLTLEALVFLVEFYVPLLETDHLPLKMVAALVFVRPLVTEVFVGGMLLQGALRGNRDAPLLLMPVALWSISDIYGIVQGIVSIGFKVVWPDLPKLHAFTYTVEFVTMADVLGMLSLVMIILRRTVLLSREKADLAAEVAAAEEVQQLLMARALRPTPGYRGGHGVSAHATGRRGFLSGAAV